MNVEGMDAIRPIYGTSNKPEIKIEQKPVSIPNEKTESGDESEKKKIPISEKTVFNAIEGANKAILGTYRRFEFSIHEKTREIMVKVIDTQTDEVVREIPPEKVLDMVATMWEMAGIIVDERR